MGCRWRCDDVVCLAFRLLVLKHCKLSTGMPRSAATGCAHPVAGSLLVVLALFAQRVTPAVAAAGTAQSPDAPRPSFSEWLADIRQEALARGIRQDIVDAAPDDVQEPLPIILERDRAQ